ncbi:unnamed protein product [Blepharisma stoltei]|uniref:Autophagy-related protein 27 n=1 Tax=Blepharisma stoltei TaxID=1481888 RepID=A0AAU9JEX7_9CILI|nr:unnamed protein product [Blepharisma stoltei]
MMWVLLLFNLASAGQYPCKFTMPDGDVIDLSSLYTEIPDYEMDAMDFVYRNNICGDTHKTCGVNTGIATQWEYNGGCVAVLARQSGTPPVATYINPDDPDLGIRLTYFNGDSCGSIQRQVIYNIHCAKEKTRMTMAEEFSLCVYTFEVNSKLVCPGKSGVTKKSSSGLSRGTWILLLSVILFAAYCIIGSILNRKNDPELSISESIPHKAFWAELPSLVGDGVQFTVSKGREIVGRITGRE